MEKWQWTTLILCTFGLFKEFRPSEPFIVDYAMDFGHFTDVEVVHEILPTTTYANLFAVLILLFITDFLRYKPVIIFGGICFIASWVITIWAYDGILLAQVRQMVNAIAISSELAYYTYMYANVERSHYKQVTSYTHSALHVGKFISGLTGQFLVSFSNLELSEINYLSLAGVTVAFLVTPFLPRVKRSIYFYPPRGSVVSTAGDITNAAENGIPVKNPREIHKHLEFRARMKRAFSIFKGDFKKAYSNRYVLKWSLWWSIGMAVYLQVGLYAESLWRKIEEDTHQNIYNGYVDASHALLSAVIGIALAIFKFPWFKWGEIYLSSISFLQASTLIIMSQTHDLYVAYITYVIFQTLFQVMIIIATAEVIEGVNEDSEAFIFGLNTLMALVIQTVLTYTVTSANGFALNIRDEFVVYGIYSGILGMAFLIIAIQNRSKHWEIETSTDVLVAPPSDSSSITVKNRRKHFEVETPPEITVTPSDSNSTPVKNRTNSFIVDSPPEIVVTPIMDSNSAENGRKHFKVETIPQVTLTPSDSNSTEIISGGKHFKVETLPQFTLTPSDSNSTQNKSGRRNFKVETLPQFTLTPSDSNSTQNKSGRKNFKVESLPQVTLTPSDSNSTPTKSGKKHFKVEKLPQFTTPSDSTPVKHLRKDLDVETPPEVIVTTVSDAIEMN